MGANAQIEVPAFTAGQVLTAAEMTQINTGIPVFATTVTRDAAFGGAGEKVLAEGQYAYIEATNTTQYYDGSAWQTLGQTPGLVCVKAETPFTATTSVTADGVFTSAYTNYLVMYSATGTGTHDVTVQLRTGGVTAATAYSYQVFLANNTTLTGVRSSSQTSFLVTSALRNGLKTSLSFSVFGPQLAAATQLYSTAIDYSATDPTLPTMYNITGIHSTATAYDGIIISTAGNATGYYAIYGYSKTV